MTWEFCSLSLSCPVALSFLFVFLFFFDEHKRSRHLFIEACNQCQQGSSIVLPLADQHQQSHTKCRRVIWISFAPERAAAPSPRPWGPMGSLPMRKLCNQVGGVQIPTGHDTMGPRCPGVFGWWHRCMVQQEAATTLSEPLMLILSCTEMAHIVSGICLRGSG